MGAAGRTRDQVIPVILKGSQYEVRLPIGDTLTIQEGHPDAVRRYYDRWYRPDLMAIVVVGDLSADVAEGFIREYFADWEQPASAHNRPTFDVPLSEETVYKVITDPELSAVQLEIMHRRPAAPRYTQSDYRRYLVERLTGGIFNRRLAEIARDGTRSPFLWGRLTTGSIVRPLRTHSLAAQVVPDSMTSGSGASWKKLHGCYSMVLPQVNLIDRRVSCCEPMSVPLMIRKTRQAAHMPADWSTIF